MVHVLAYALKLLEKNILTFHGLNILPMTKN